jgi:hypothetical protein
MLFLNDNQSKGLQEGLENKLLTFKKTDSLDKVRAAVKKTFTVVKGLLVTNGKTELKEREK